jgi:16S rRNA processing protein RimM
VVDRLEVGRIDRPHGVRGEVVVRLITDRLERVSPGAVLYSEKGPLTVRSSTPHQHRWIVRFAEVSDRAAAEALHGSVLRADPIHDEDALWVHDLVGAQVRTTTGEVVGRIDAVQANPASDLLVIGEHLVPVVFVVDRSELPEALVIDPPAGLLDL